MDNIRKFFFSLRGRIPRETYVDAWAALLSAEIAMTWLVSFLYLTGMCSSDGGRYIFPIYAVWIAFTAIVYASQTVLAAHRLHVLGRSGLWAVLAPLATVLSLLAWRVLDEEMEEHWAAYTGPGQDSLGLGAGLMLLAGAAFFVGQLIYLVIGLLEDRAPTRHGNG